MSIDLLPKKTYNLEPFGLMFMVDGSGKEWTCQYYTHYSKKCDDRLEQQKGKTIDEAAANMSKIKKGTNQSKERREKTSQVMKGVNCKKVINVVSGLIYNSVVEASKSIGIDRTTLIKKLKGHTKNSTNLTYYKSENRT